ncbi:YbjN domain-containing protein [Neisseria subflava]|uniref:YbjN domain-containing protein n=1 Tax=Neisseria subflava TaxID=28449 RepID=A0A9X9HXF9_NEISU|nr:YbjN domain-containing protein [Neisseria subflava]UTG71397.1 YbjN domain-containing protein [Neisseria subflava]
MKDVNSVNKIIKTFFEKKEWRFQEVKLKERNFYAFFIYFHKVESDDDNSWSIMLHIDEEGRFIQLLSILNTRELKFMEEKIKLFEFLFEINQKHKLIKCGYSNNKITYFVDVLVGDSLLTDEQLDRAFSAMLYNLNYSHENIKDYLE